MVRAPYLDKNGITKGAWSENEDNKLRAHIEKYGHKNWRKLPKQAGLQRCGKSCMLRWMNYLRPDIKRGSYRDEEEDIIIKYHSILGNKWATIAAMLPGRSDNEIKNYWHTHLRKRSKQCSTTTSTVSHSETESVQNPKCSEEKGVPQVYEKENRDEVEMLIAVLSSDSSFDANNQQQSSSSSVDHMASNGCSSQWLNGEPDRNFWIMDNDFFMDSTNKFVSSSYGHDVIVIDDVLWPITKFCGL